MPGLERTDAIGRLADAVATLPPPARIVVAGIDAAGKTTLAAELAEAFRHRGVAVTRICADDFLRPAAERHARGRDSPEGYYLDSFDHARLRQAVERGGGGAVTVVDGIFLFRPELNDLWDFRVYVHVELEESIRRGIERDAVRHGSSAAAERLYQQRYAPAQQAYLDRVAPAALADVVVDNSNPDAPRMVFRAGEAAASA